MTLVPVVGVDFVGDINLPHIDFATVHVYPGKCFGHICCSGAHVHSCSLSPPPPLLLLSHTHTYTPSMIMRFVADNWGIPASDFEWVNDNFIADRASIAHSAGKPIIMEESGMKTGYVSSRNSFLADIYQWANENDYAGTLVWQVYAW